MKMPQAGLCVKAFFRQVNMSQAGLCDSELVLVENRNHVWRDL